MCEYVLHGRVSCQVTVVTGTCVSRALSVCAGCRVRLRARVCVCCLVTRLCRTNGRGGGKVAVCGLPLRTYELRYNYDVAVCFETDAPSLPPSHLAPLAAAPQSAPFPYPTSTTHHLSSPPLSLSRRVCRPCHIFNVSSHPSAHTRRFLFQCCPSFPTTPVARHLFCSSSNWPDQRVCAGRAHSVTSRARSLSQRSESRRRASR